jgi:hypothetical protein
LAGPQAVLLQELIDDRLLDAGPAPNWHYGATGIANAYLDSRHSYSAFGVPFRLQQGIELPHGVVPGLPGSLAVCC